MDIRRTFGKRCTGGGLRNPLFAIGMLALGAGPAGAQLDFTLEATEGAGLLGEEIEISILLDNPNGPNDEVNAYSFGLCHDPAIASVSEVAYAATDLPGYPTFHEVQILTDGFTVGVVIDSFGSIALPPGTDQELEVATYLPSAPGTTALDFCNDLGSVAAINSGPSWYAPVTISGQLTGLEEYTFRRGDCNHDGAFDVADTIFLEQYLFVSGDVPPCLGACDSNDDDTIDIADAIYWLMYLFIGGTPPAAPFPECGMDPGPLSCDAPCP